LKPSKSYLKHSLVAFALALQLSTPLSRLQSSSSPLISRMVWMVVMDVVLASSKRFGGGECTAWWRQRWWCWWWKMVDGRYGGGKHITEWRGVMVWYVGGERIRIEGRMAAHVQCTWGVWWGYLGFKFFFFIVFLVLYLDWIWAKSSEGWAQTPNSAFFIIFFPFFWFFQK